MVQTFDLRKSFRDGRRGEVVAVGGVSFHAMPGQIFGLLGVNGAGKTTTLRMLSTVVRPSGGTARVAGFDVLEHPQRVRASIGFMSTSTALYGRLSAREMIEYFGSLYGLGGKALKSRVNEIVDRLQIGEFSHRLCDKLSTGQRQRVSIARTILHDPPVLFFDEPTAGLDVRLSQTVMEFIEDARNDGKTILLSTHIMSEAERLCDEVAIIHDGVLQAHGTVAKLKEQAGESSFERAFLKLIDFQSEYRPGASA
ncbi:MAG TPA: ATP-binding cassette domain-containing protein [Fimbriimonadaceae bacterium]|nr:ATP-binding cassette domain-containing protein [Fimbriimonadaceae bacterium]